MRFLLLCCKVLLLSPREFIFNSIFYSFKKTIIRPYNPRTFTIGRSFIRMIKSTLPELKIYLIGSTGLKISGRGDIDLYAIAPKSTFSQLIPRLSVYLGPPAKIRPQFVEWYSNYKNIPVEFILTDPGHKPFINHLIFFRILKSNIKARKEYEILKNKCCFLSEYEYNLRRLEFSHRVLSANSSVNYSGINKIGLI